MANDLSRQRNQTGTPCECNEPSAAVSQNHASDERLISRQLCELCGVEPKKIKKCKVGQGCADFPGCEGRFGDKTCYIEQTVDFTKPENFVRLFNLITTIEGYVYRTGFYYIKYIPTHRQLSCLSTDEGEYSSENTDPIKAFITCVIKCARAEKDTADYIREAEWVYD